MENKDLEWIADVIEKLQSPMVYNERQRLTKILERVAPALIEAIDYTAIVGFSSYNEQEDKFTRCGETCNGCGQDHYFAEENPKHYSCGTRDNPDAKLPCVVEDLLHILKKEEADEDK